MIKWIWTFFKKLIHFCWKIAEILFVLILILGSITLYQLHKEPIDGKKYIPEIEKALLPKDSGYHFEAKSVILTSDLSREGLIQVDIKNLKLFRSDNTIAFEAPEATISYNLWHILTLNYLPSTFILEKPFVEMIIDEKGEVAVKTEKSQARSINAKSFKKMLQRILDVHELRISDAHLHIKDLKFNQEWDMPDANFELERHFHFKNTASLNATLKGEGVNTHFLATADLNRFKKELFLEAGMDKINLQKISDFIPVLKEANLEIQFSLKTVFDFSHSHKEFWTYLKKCQFNAKTLKEGTLNLMDDLDNVYYVQSADINGSLSSGGKTLKIASSKIMLKDEKPADFYLDVAGIDVFLKKNDISALKTILRANLYDVPTSHVPALWPSKQGPDAHQWVKESLSQGKLSRADFTLYFTGDELTDLLGDIHAEGVRVDYLAPMKPVDNVSAQVLLYPDKVRILANKGEIGKLSLKNADLLFSDLDKDITKLKIDLDIDGPVEQALDLISSKPLEFTQMFGLKPSLISGQAETKVELDFPLLDDLGTDQIQVSVHADMTDVKINAPLDYLGLKNGKLTLDVTNEKLELSGDIMFKNSPLSFKWDNYFLPKEISSEAFFSGTIKTLDAGEIFPILNPLLDGEIEFNLQAIENAKTNLLSGKLNLNAENAFVDIAPLAVQKKQKNPLALTVSFSDMDLPLNQGKIDWDMTGSLKEKQDDLKIKGQAQWDKKGIRVLSDVLAKENQFSGELKSTLSDFVLTFKGKNWLAYDLGKIIPPSEKTDSLPAKTQPKNITLDILLDELSLNKTKPLKNILISGKRRGAFWKNFKAQAKAKESFSLVYDATQKRFQGGVSDFGDFLNCLSISDRFMGGEFSLNAEQIGTGNIKGEVKVEKTELKETGFLIQAMTILGIVDAFRGKDLLFDEILVPFQIMPDFDLTLTDGYAVGTNMGITFKGNISMDGMDLSGAVVPAYAVNSLPGKIPLVGWLFRDSAGGGLINVPYSIKGSLTSPEVNWNPLKTAAPGALGRLF